MLRPFRKEDTNAVLELANAYAAFDGTTSEADLAITAHFPNGFWVADEGGKVVGFAYGYFKEVPGEVLERWGAKRVGSIELMAVAPAHRRKGLGRSLVDKLLDEFKKAGADMVLLNCPAQATEARSLYTAMGFDVRFVGMKKRI
jgi:ribosomal protein S18 acetylase RimI-like enzyme